MTIMIINFFGGFVGVKYVSHYLYKLNTKVIMLPQSSTKSSDMLNKNTLGVKKCKANKKQPYICATKIFDIS